MFICNISVHCSKNVLAAFQDLDLSITSFHGAQAHALIFITCQFSVKRLAYQVVSIALYLKWGK